MLPATEDEFEEYLSEKIRIAKKYIKLITYLLTHGTNGLKEHILNLILPINIRILKL